jgi:DNA-binding NtrC family response regulator
MSRRLRTALVVEDDADLRTALTGFLRTKLVRVAAAGSAADAIAQLRGRPDVIVLDVWLPDGDAFKVLDHARRLAPAPIRIAMSGHATPEESFRLAQFGVRRYLQKPVSLDGIWDAICSASEEPPDLKPLVQETVGRMPLRDILSRVREEAIRQAFAIARGNRTAAARILSVTRQAVQQMLRDTVARKSPRA